MNRFLLDNPLVRAMLFYPQRARPGTSHLPNAHDGTVALPDVEIGYRLYGNRAATATLLCFHGNAEAAADYDVLAPFFWDLGVSLLVADYRGYGWSSGRPRASALLPDAEGVFHQLAAIFSRHGAPAAPVFLWGRSLGSAPAIHLAYRYPDQIAGLILESGFAHAPSVLSPLFGWLPGLFGNRRKIAQIHLPLLVIHGEKDRVIPVRQGQILYDVSPSPHKRLLRVPRAGHNDLIASAARQYFATIRQFIADALAAAA